ncbi:CD209 antigen-like protein A [Brienomyrus brachyistius]|uniref:CD209 antigen-like protein A n=1 Tax=Brienomyrus brachyistius TaxID=42636 RepID=UPI0020B26A3E|nr:CD209 antigen-like protein A [Brienomyrus brachyistius]XP_048855540.1 CD209 antigen-like protein A [Brienomyrus brachyistius]
MCFKCRVNHYAVEQILYSLQRIRSQQSTRQRTAVDMELVTAHRKHSPAERDTGDQYRRLKMKMSDDTCISTNVDENIYANKMDEDVYANADIIKANEAPKGTSSPMEQTSRRSQHSGSEPAGARWYRLATVCLGMLCLLLLLIITVISVYYKGALHEGKANMLKAEREETNYNTLRTERDQLQANYSTLTIKFSQLEEKVRYAEEHRCPVGWNSFSLKCYYISDKKNSWVDSQKDCRERGADLVVIDSNEEQIFISQFRRAWIGLTDREHEGNWKWVDGTRITISYWAPGEPNDSGKEEDCAEAYTEHDTVKNWNDKSCSVKLHWICEGVVGVVN